MVDVTCHTRDWSRTHTRAVVSLSQPDDRVKERRGRSFTSRSRTAGEHLQEPGSYPCCLRSSQLADPYRAIPRDTARERFAVSSASGFWLVWPLWHAVGVRSATE